MSASAASSVVPVDEAAQLLVSAMETLCVPVFVCRPDGQVQALSAQALRLVTEGRLCVRGQRLCAADPSGRRELLGALGAAAAGLPPPRRYVVLRVPGDEPIVLEIAPAPEVMRSALVLVHIPNRDVERLRAIAGALFGLTAAEAAVAADLVRGRRPQQIAEHNGVSVGTVRTHIRRIYEKADVSSVAELLSRIPA